MNFYKDLNITILSRDRPKSLERTIISILKQSDSKQKICISDNSINNKPIKEVSRKFKKCKFVYRSRKYDIISHYQKVFLENKKKYLFIAADDDIYNINFLSECMKFLIKKNVSAVATNGFLYYKKILEKNKIRSFFKTNCLY